MRRLTTLLLLSVWLLISGLLGAKARALTTPTGEELVSKRPVYKTADELREACEPYLKPMDPEQMRTPQDDEYLLFIVPYLGSEDAELRDAAADILAELMKLRRHVRASAFTKYLSREYPLSVRVVALAHSILRFLGREEVVPDGWAGMKPAWTETLNDIAESPVTPPDFDVLALALYFQQDCVALVKPENQPVMVRRLLVVMSRESRQDRDLVMELICRFPPGAAAGEALAWYRAEPDAGIRAAYVDRIGFQLESLSKIFGRPSSVENVEKLKPVLELAAQDTDAGIAERARMFLEKADAFLEKEKALSEREGK